MACAASSASAIWREKRSASLSGKGRAQDALLERLAAHELEDENAEVVDLLEVVDRRDARMVQRREDVRLAGEAGEPVGVLRERPGHDLEGHFALETRVARAPDLAHASGSERAEDLVGPEAGAGSDEHRDFWRLSAPGPRAFARLAGIR